MKFGIGIVALVLPFMAPQPAQSHDVVEFTVQTQNVLRFGHGRRLSNQCDEIETISANVDMIVMQEVMAAGYPCLKGNNKKSVNKALPPGFAYETSKLKGKSSYVEYYGTLFRTGGGISNIQIKATGTTHNSTDYTKFARPPYAIQFEVEDTSTNQKCMIWVVNIHAIFGKTIGGRRGDATAMKGFYDTVVGLSSGAVLAFGDWNLASDDAAFDWVRVAAHKTEIFPNVKTSLTRDGVPSSPYDHIIRPSTTTVVTQVLPPSAPTRWTYPAPANLKTWRKNASDHMGVRTKVKVTC